MGGKEQQQFLGIRYDCYGHKIQSSPRYSEFFIKLQCKNIKEQRSGIMKISGLSNASKVFLSADSLHLCRFRIYSPVVCHWALPRAMFAHFPINNLGTDIACIPLKLGGELNLGRNTTILVRQKQNGKKTQ